jgi:hypothetical protein
MMNTTRADLISIVVALLAAHRVARADAPDPDMQGPPTREPERSGLTVTLAIGPGEVHRIPDNSDEQRIEGAAFSLRIGTTITPTAVIDAMIDFVEGSGSRSTVFGGTVKLYTGPALYFRLGGGLGLFSPPSSMTGMGTPSRFWGPAATAAVGYEWFQLRDLGLFGEFELTGNRLITQVMGQDPSTTVINAQVVFGVTWY